MLPGAMQIDDAFTTNVMNYYAEKASRPKKVASNGSFFSRLFRLFRKRVDT